MLKITNHRKFVSPAFVSPQVVNKAELESLRTVLANWPGAAS
jgi:hypothetical protein